ncbi:hypothetical protein LSH36_74g14060 [Paralvinella palmiformis]|uniref:WD repeat-containing protein 91 n=1 Tax=Paralvinella palmiformis TaxID=53620 RepID=A0AAD9K2R4_9ANNE|nr:hypothetical protein LSH36_74g14060 [Paralvinella palmiformis]
MKIEKSLSTSVNLPAINWSCYNHNGQLLVTAAVDGCIRLFDTRTGDCISSWSAHQGEIYSAMFSVDQTTCYTIGADSKFIQWSIHNTGQQLSSTSLHQGAVGPFVFTGHGGYRQVQTPKGKLFALESEGQHLLTCAPTGAQMYKINKDGSLLRSLYLGGHRSPVVTVDWSPVADCRLCLSGSMDGRVRVSSVIPP